MGGQGAWEVEFLLLPAASLQLTLPSGACEATYWEGDVERTAIAGSTGLAFGVLGAEGIAQKGNLKTWAVAYECLYIGIDRLEYQ